MKGKRKLKIWMIGIIVVLAACIALYQPLVNYLLPQASNPNGLLGRITTKIWSTYFQDLSKWSFTHVNLYEYGTILDVGFGGGSSIKYMKDQGTECIIYGVDISEESVKTATKENQTYVDSGEVILTLGDVGDLQFENEIFELVVASQTHIYWDELNTGLSECYRVLKPEGTLLITCEIDKIEYHLPEYQNPNDFEALLYETGFEKVDVVISNNYIAFICVK
ncbi:MAG TPA: class I SAM-dependent methyltransferase [Lachnospiraceae bacterium]|nr:class I SAM-dependent methyltransferase [Lachnospiraceae bacterium]